MYSKLLIFVAAAFVAVSAQAGKKPAATPAPTPKVAAAASPASAFSHNLTFVLSGINVPTKDKNSKADAFVKVSSLDTTKKEDNKKLIGETDYIQDNENPEWLKVFWVDWKRGTNQKIQIDVFDHDTLGRNDEIGYVIVDLDQYVDKNQDQTLPISGGGMLRIQRTIPNAFKVYCRNLPRKDQFNGKSDPYVEVYWRKGKEGKEDHLIGTTATIDNEDNPDFPETFHFDNYQKGTNQWLLFKVYDSDSLTSSDYLGDLLIEADPYVMKRQTKITKLAMSDGKATLAITPV